MKKFLQGPSKGSDTRSKKKREGNLDPQESMTKRRQAGNSCQALRERKRKAFPQSLS